MQVCVAPLAFLPTHRRSAKIMDIDDPILVPLFNDSDDSADALSPPLLTIEATKPPKSRAAAC